jgi:GTPase
VRRIAAAEVASDFGDGALSPDEQTPERLVRVDEPVDLHALVTRVGEARVPWPEVDGVQPAGGEVGHVRPRLLGLDRARTRRDEVGDHAVRRRDGARRCCAEYPQLRSGRHQRLEQGNRARLVAVRCETEVQVGDGAVGDDIVGDSCCQPRDGEDLGERQPLDDGVASWVSGELCETGDGVLDRVVGEPRSSRMAARAVEDELGVDVADAAGVHLSVGRLQQHRERGFVHEVGLLEQEGQRIPLGRQLLLAEQHQPDVEPRGADLPEVAGELQRNCEATLHVARSEAMHGAVRDSAGNVALRRHRVVVADEQQQRRAGAARPDVQGRILEHGLGSERLRHECAHVVPNLVLVAALGRDVDELQRALRQALGERCHAREPICILQRMTLRQPDPFPGAEPERGFVVAVLARGVDAADELGELRELSRTAGVEPVAELVQQRPQPSPKSYVGKGKLRELQEGFAASEADVLLVDDELDPTQQRALENALGARVVDRTQLILDIFAQHAVSAEGKLQVELAQLEYNLPRMRGMWQHLERLGGGVGTRGPGESQLETDRRIARRRISLLKRRLDVLRGQRQTRRKERARTETPTVALAGYTNVGKSTLLNALTGADVSVENRLFETLDPTTRGFSHEGKRFLVTDTVGFIRRLPTQLVEGFASTLEETLVADVILHVVDASLPDDRMREQIDAVATTLEAIGADEVASDIVLNKIDRVDPDTRRRLANALPGALQVSAATGDGIPELKGQIAALFAARFEDVRLLVPFDDGRVLSDLYALGAPIAERRDTAEGVIVRAHLQRRDVRRFAAYLVAGDEIEAAPTT